ncbi:hypothetical protein SMACR_05641 [Sordaria macrospora]|uniref:Uncharacterized protein n=1 Tax=Sordaria macrospora TaxID=5147 RepID=A0A8S8ZPA5_SORMA|nr:hypothetical protein SMACR_05641 [Sordaria macrospora]WPJ62488.1 hypothetical protein SMAC4_05641 [Sordaria macrospora]
MGALFARTSSNLKDSRNAFTSRKLLGSLNMRFRAASIFRHSDFIGNKSHQSQENIPAISAISIVSQN